MSLKIELQTRILNHPEIEWKKSRFSKEEAFFVGSREIAHFHRGNEIDVRLTRKEIKARGLQNSEDPRVHVRTSSTDWVELKFRRESDLAFVQEFVAAAAIENLKDIRQGKIR